MPDVGLDLSRYLEAIEDCEYAIVKLPAHFPRMQVGEDLDIVAVDKESIARKLLSAASDDVSRGGYVARASYGPDEECVHVDLLKNDAIELRFDIASQLPSFGAYRVRPTYARLIVDNATRTTSEVSGKPVSISVAHEIDELVIRYLEYHELFDRRPDKVKHLEYVLREVEHEPSRRAFLDRLHENVRLPLRETAPVVSPLAAHAPYGARQATRELLLEGRRHAGRIKRRLRALLR